MSLNIPFSISQYLTLRSVLLLVLLIIALTSLSQGLWIKAKAELAQVLISSSWQENSQGASKKPWPWADMEAVAELSFSDRDESLIALQGIEGNSLAFGPGLITAINGDEETVVIAGHNDTHFQFLPELQPQSRIFLQRKNSLDEYVVTHSRIVDSSKESMRFTEGEDLLLVTCYPFHNIDRIESLEQVTNLGRNGPLRYVVSARRIMPSEQQNPRIKVNEIKRKAVSRIESNPLVSARPIYF